MIYIVEIPHQRPASCWHADDEQDALNRINADLAHRHIAEEAESYEDAIAINGADLYAQHVLSEDEAMEALSSDGKDLAPHQRMKALSALRGEMINAGLLEDAE